MDLKEIQTSLKELANSINDTITSIESLWTIYNKEKTDMEILEEQLYRPLIEFSSVINFGFKQLSKSLYRTSNLKKEFKTDLYKILEIFYKKRVKFITHCKNGRKFLHSDIFSSVEKFKIQPKPLLNNSMIFDIEIPEEEKKLPPILQKKKNFEIFKYKFPQTVYPSKNSIYIGQLDSKNKKSGIGVLIKISNPHSNLSEALTQGILFGIRKNRLDEKIQEKNFLKKNENFESTYVYFGEFFENLFHGVGVHIDNKGNRYEGEWINGKKKGKGKINFSDGSSYDGNWDFDVFHGFGIFKNFKGEKNPGLWEKGILKIKNLNSGYIVGNCLVRDLRLKDPRTWSKIKKEEISVFEEKDDFSIESKSPPDYTTFEKLKNGYCQIHFKDGSSYTGYWQNFQRHGYGELEFLNSEKYSGEWQHGKLHGLIEFKSRSMEPRYDLYFMGELKIENIEKNSNFTLDKLSNGFEEINFANGDYYKGNWREFQFHGEGEFYSSARNLKINTEFIQGRKHGIGVVSSGSSSKKVVFFKDEILIENIKNDFDEFEFEKLISGKCLMEYEDGGWYDGFWKNCRSHGEGNLKESKGCLLYGIFAEGKIHGYGYEGITGSQKREYKIWNYGQEKIKNLVRINKDKIKKFNVGDLINGSCYLKFSNEEYYDGAWVDYKKHGLGKLHHEYFSYYGQFNHGKLQGRGLTYLRNDESFNFSESDLKENFKLEGDPISKEMLELIKIMKNKGSEVKVLSIFENNVPVLIDIDIEFNKKEGLDMNALKKGGPTRIKFSNGDEYIGLFWNYKFQGKGRFSSKSKSEIYEGEFQNGLREGNGVLKKGGKEIKGYWIQGELANENNLNIGLSLVSEKISETLTIVRKKVVDEETGDVYEGDLLNSKIRQGQGVLKCSDGSIYSGGWRGGRKHGLGVSKNKNGVISLDLWQNGEIKIFKLDLGYSKKNKQRLNVANLQAGQSDEIVKFSDGGFYKGKWKNFKKNGKGEFKFFDELISKFVVFQGEFKNDKKHGKGILTKDAMNIIYGVWFEDKLMIETTKDQIEEDKISFENLKNGNQEIIYKNGDYYKGSWLNCKKNGIGEYRWANGSFYKGSFKDDQQYGYGEYTKFRVINNEFNSQAQIAQTVVSKRVGIWKYCELKIENTIKNLESVKIEELENGGYQRLKYKNHDIYEGNWLKFKKHGFGKLTKIDGSFFVGNFKNGAKHGEGKEYNTKGELIEKGIWFEGIKLKLQDANLDLVQFGKRDTLEIKYKNKKNFKGVVQNFERNGYGEFQYPDGGHFEGYFKDNKRHGYGKYFFKKKNIEGIWIRGHQVFWIPHNSVYTQFAPVTWKLAKFLENKFSNNLKIFDVLTNSSKREAVAYVNENGIDLNRVLNKILKFKFREERDKIEAKKRLYSGEADYEGYWDMWWEKYAMTQQQLIMNQYNLNSKQENQENNLYRKLIKKITIKHENLKSLNSSEEEVEKKRNKNKNYSKLRKDFRTIVVKNVTFEERFEKEFNEASVILESVRDGDDEIFTKILVFYLRKGQGTSSHMKTLLTTKDSKGRNPFHLACYFGQSLMFLHLCGILKILIKEEERILSKIYPKKQDKYKKRLKKKTKWLYNLIFEKDIDGNTPLDLACIKGYSFSKDDIASFDEKDLGIIDEYFDEIEQEKLKFLREEGGNQKVFSPYQDNLKYIKANFRNFSQNCKLKNLNSKKMDLRKNKKSKKRKAHDYLKIREIDSDSEDTEELIGNMIEETYSPESTRDLCFISTRAYCVYVLIKLVKSLKMEKNLIQRDDYIRRNSPLHWGFYWSDLYMVSFLLEFEIDLIFWQNEEKQYPPQMIKRTETDIKKLVSLVVIIFKNYFF